MDNNQRSVENSGGIVHQQRKESSQGEQEPITWSQGKGSDGGGGTRDPASLFQNQNSLFKLHLQNIYIFIYKV